MNAVKQAGIIDELSPSAAPALSVLTASGNGAVKLDEVTKLFGRGSEAVLALDRLSLAANPGEFLCVVGASGCGKSTMLNLIAGLDRPTSGLIEARGRTALMFQEAALFPWLTVTGNIDLALKLRGIPRAERRDRTGELLKMVHLDGFGKKRPHELSGGMRQRVSLARAFAQDAEILLMDEPFGALDAMTRDLLHEELAQLWRERNITIVFVTHNVREAVRLGDRVVLLSSRPGRVAAEFPVHIERPRRIESPDVSDLSVVITEQLREEVRRHARH
jgi:NitT/TauT family transport system ATP-binding protein